MRMRAALLSAAIVAMAAVTIAEAAKLTATGTVLATSRDALVVRIDDHGHRMEFALDKPSLVPPGVTAGSRVSVTYHPTGSTGQAADEVALLAGGTARARRGKTSAPPQGKAE
jgi:hypothetical protein